MIKKFIILNLLFSTINAFILPQFVREWHPIGIDSQIDRNKPYIFNIGKLPMVLWYDYNNTPVSTINICKHLGAKLDNGLINNGCLHCPNHLTAYNQSDGVGKVISKNGLLWWSYKSYSKNPPSNFKGNNKTDIYHIDIDVNLVNVILEFVYSNNKLMVKHRKNKFLFKETLFNAEHRFFYKYPYYLKGSINNKISYAINFLPLEENKTRLYISVLNNYIDSKIFMNYYLNTKLNNLNNYNGNSYLKYLIILKDHNDYMKNLYLLFDKYLFPNDFSISCFYKYRQFY